MEPIGTALVVDHDVTRLEALAALVAGMGFTPEKYTDPNAAREYLRSRPDLDVILCEMDMEGLSWDVSTPFTAGNGCSDSGDSVQ